VCAVVLACSPWAVFFSASKKRGPRKQFLNIGSVSGSGCGARGLHGRTLMAASLQRGRTASSGLPTAGAAPAAFYPKERAREGGGFFGAGFVGL